MSRAIQNQTFLQEAEDLLTQIEAIALELRPGEPPGEAVHQLFRAFHTLKGSGAMFGFDDVARFTHHLETVLDRVREGALPLSDRLIELVLLARDEIKRMLDGARDGAETSSDSTEGLVRELLSLSPAQADATSGQDGKSDEASVRPPDDGAVHTFRIRFEPPRGLMTSGTNPALLLNELRALGECLVKADTSSVPALDQIQPDLCYLAWDIELTTSRDANSIKDVFIFVEEESKLSIELAKTAAALLEQAPVAAPATDTKSLAAVPAGRNERAASANQSTVRVSSERLDRLVALVGEMVMNQSRLTQVAESSSVANLTAPVEELERLVADLRDTVLGIRMMPIGATFNRYKRLVHDLSAQLGKQITLVTEGAETELDKTVLDQLGDPLVHLIRNCIDHGIESPAERQAAGKQSPATIRLSAAHTGSNVVITIQDDGRGLNTQAIRAKALEKQLISADAKLTNEAIHNLIFLPGFSTAQEVTSLSGRGVGMDVVRRQIEALRGSIQLSSEPGKGTSVALTLPLTLAIIDGLLVEIGPVQFIIPMSAVAENVELARADRSRQNGRNLIAVRGELVPYLCLREDFALDGEEPEKEKVVIVRQGSERVGLVVDRVLGSHQTVIQSLGRFYKNIEVVSGATIMGDGRVALILDLSGVLRWCARRDSSISLPSSQTN